MKFAPRQVLCTWWESLWFVPGVITLASLVTAGLLSGLGLNLFVADRRASFDPADAGGVLTSLGAGAITVAAVVFSITMVVLSSASSQFGPRLLPNFMRKTGTKLAIGGFVGAFAYQMLVAAALATDLEVGDLAVWVGLAGSLGAFVILLGFLHMVARFIQVPYVVDEVTQNLKASLEAFLEFRREHVHCGPSVASAGLEPLLEIRARRDGYVQRINTRELFKLGGKHDVLIRVPVRAGSFVAVDDILAVVHGTTGRDRPPEKRFAAAFTIGPERTPQQDVEFAVRQLVEIAAKALSPGINDPYTAINAIERMGGAFAVVIHEKLPSGLWHDDQGALRLAIPLTNAHGLLDAAYLPLRQNSRNTEAVAIALMDSLLALAERRPHPDFRDGLGIHADLLLEDFERLVTSGRDRMDFRQRYDLMVAALTEDEG